MKIAVMGSINVDIIYTLKSSLNKGETRFADSYDILDGGKGANQAVMLKALHKNTVFLGAVGSDTMGQKALENLQSKDLSENILTHSEPTGLAIIQIIENDNKIIVFPGANLTISYGEIDRFLEQHQDLNFVVTQLETPINSVLYFLQKAHNLGIKTVLNPAPAPQDFDLDFLKFIDYLIPNETELFTIFGHRPIDEILSDFPSKVIVTLGEKGVKFSDGDRINHLQAEEIDLVDTTGAGDSFIAGFVKGLSEKLDLKNAIKKGIQIASLTCQRFGAQGAYHELIKIYQKRGGN